MYKRLHVRSKGFLVKKELSFFIVKEKKQVFRALNTEGGKVVLFFAGKKTKKDFVDSHV